MSDYQAAKEVQENERNPKNRFMGLFCHASQVDISWGWNWPFWLGVVIFSILVGFMSVFDIIYLLQSQKHNYLDVLDNIQELIDFKIDVHNGTLDKKEIDALIDMYRTQIKLK